MPALSSSMTLEQFDHGYWYALELKRFAVDLGIPRAAALRKDELEREIRQFLRTGRVSKRRPEPVSRVAGQRDVDLGLSLGRRVVRYTNDPATKQFLEEHARKLAPGFRRRSGARYRLNRWREDQLRRGVELTYRDLVEQYVRLNQATTRFARVPHGRYINFLADFLARQPGATKEAAIAAWHDLKTMDCPKTYEAWRRARARPRRGGR